MSIWLLREVKIEYTRLVLFLLCKLHIQDWDFIWVEKDRHVVVHVAVRGVGRFLPRRKEAGHDYWTLPNLEGG